ncbi:MAG TPA: hypothetical protein VNL36_05050 [Bacteroidota bacterium]|nr:hypothetical protein [Bacteroidota bacterium]
MEAPSDLSAGQAGATSPSVDHTLQRQCRALAGVVPKVSDILSEAKNLIYNQMVPFRGGASERENESGLHHAG